MVLVDSSKSGSVKLALGARNAMHPKYAYFLSFGLSVIL